GSPDAPTAAPAPPAPPTPPPPVTLRQDAPPAPEVMRRIEQDWDQAHGFDPDAPLAPAPQAPLPERLRRWAAIGAGAIALGAGFAAAPWVATLVVVLAVWLLRAGSLAASAIAERRTLRGAKWYDGLRWLSTSPWHLVRAVTGTVVLVTWSAGLGLAAGLICYALALDVPSTLMACGATLGVALWSGPGGSRFRSPVARVLYPACRSTLPWLFTCAGLLAVAAVLGVLVAGRGVTWVPWSSGPFGL
ncbi:MAG TPA: hypothetical protein VNS46_12815, partial [Nocardioides sp.]|nr:hypothetical protein [Nocardioides sp.]